MNILDIILAIIILLPAITGLRNGFIKRIFSLTGIIVGLYLAAKLNSKVTPYITIIFKLSPKISSLISFILIIIAVYFLALILAKWISRINTFTKNIDRILGLALGVFQGMIIASLVVIVITSFSFVSAKTVNESLIYPYVSNIAPQLFDLIAKIFPDSKNFFEEIKFYNSLKNKILNN